MLSRFHQFLKLPQKIAGSIVNAGFLNVHGPLEVSIGILKGLSMRTLVLE